MLHWTKCPFIFVLSRSIIRFYHHCSMLYSAFFKNILKDWLNKREVMDCVIGYTIHIFLASRFCCSKMKVILDSRKMSTFYFSFQLFTSIFWKIKLDKISPEKLLYHKKILLMFFTWYRWQRCSCPASTILLTILKILPFIWTLLRLYFNLK